MRRNCPGAEPNLNASGTMIAERKLPQTASFEKLSIAVAYIYLIRIRMGTDGCFGKSEAGS